MHIDPRQDRDPLAGFVSDGVDKRDEPQLGPERFLDPDVYE